MLPMRKAVWRNRILWLEIQGFRMELCMGWAANMNRRVEGVVRMV